MIAYLSLSLYQLHRLALSDPLALEQLEAPFWLSDISRGRFHM
jgi:hypothetical protein